MRYFPRHPPGIVGLWGGGLVANIDDKQVVNTAEELSIKRLFQDIVGNLQLIFLISIKNIACQTKLSFLGFAWPVINTVITSFLFVFLFNRVGGIEVESVNYLVFVFLGTAIWSYVNKAAQTSPICIIGYKELVTRINFPRVILAVENCVVPLLELAISLLIFAVLLIYFDVEITRAALLSPLFIVVLIVLALGYTLLTAAVNSKYRDIGYLSQYFVRIWMWISPVAYPFTVIPEKFHGLYFMNPAAGIIGALRWSILGTEFSYWFCLSFVNVLVLLLVGTLTFCKHERTMIDYI